MSLTMTDTMSPSPVVPKGAGGDRATTWLYETETTVASTRALVTPPKKTCTPPVVEKPEPTIVTRVPPAFRPDAGSTAVTIGFPLASAPYTKQLGRDRTTGVAPFVPRMTVIGLAIVGDPTSMNEGVCTVICVDVTPVTMASFEMPLPLNVTRVVLGEPKNRPPFRVMVVLPVFGPELGLQNETNGSVLEDDWKLMDRNAEFDLPAEVAWALIFAVPAPGPQRAVTADPLVVTIDTSGAPLCPKVPKSVVKLTVVPSGTVVPLSVTMASTGVHVPAFGLASLVKSWT